LSISAELIVGAALALPYAETRRRSR